MAENKKDLHTLIRLRKWDVDEKQRALAVLLRQEEDVIARQRMLEEEIQAEIVFAGQAPAHSEPQARSFERARHSAQA